MKVDSEDYDSEMEERESQEKSRVWEQVQPQFLTLVIDTINFIVFTLDVLQRIQTRNNINETSFMRSYHYSVYLIKRVVHSDGLFY